MHVFLFFVSIFSSEIKYLVRVIGEGSVGEVIVSYSDVKDSLFACLSLNDI